MFKTGTHAKPNAQQVYETLRRMIIGLEIIPGSRVTESQLADYFQVSRTPIRAALQRLESDGYLSVRAKQGCFIRNIDLLQVSQYYDVRVALENMVLEEVLKLKDLSAVVQLAETWHPQKLVFGLEVSDELIEAEEGFHQQLANISKNTVLINYIEDINNQIRMVRRLGYPDEKSVQFTYDDHYRICQLLLQRDLVTAQEEMTDHIRKSQDGASRVTLHQLYGSGNKVQFGA